MSEQIKVGDLVQVVKSCCGSYLGYVRRVEKISAAPNGSICPICEDRMDSYMDCEFEGETGFDAWLLAWLKRIPPLSELEGRVTEESLRQPSKREDNAMLKERAK